MKGTQFVLHDRIRKSWEPLLDADPKPRPWGLRVFCYVLTLDAGETDFEFLHFYFLVFATPVN